MPDYDFSILDDYEFELLCRDLFNEEQRIIVKSNNGLPGGKIISFQSFKRGKDGGIDLYYEDNTDTVIGQVKLSRGKFPDLFTALQKKVNGKNEADKVKDKKPSKYVFMTSVSLSLQNKNKLKDFFSPFVLSINDIYGREDLNKLISQFENVERRHLKLYLNSHRVLDHLLNSATFSRSSISLKQFQETVKYFVQTESYSNALTILEAKRLLIIKGLPGVGKTTLAKMLSLQFAEQGYTFVEIFNLDNELERVIATEEKLILYYDDFLGSNSYTISEALRHESRLSNLLRQIIVSHNKYLILTTRTNILSNAKVRSEKLQNVFEAVTKYEVDITKLDLREKKQILFKHFNRNGLEIELLGSRIDEIISHENFNPRLIEFITYNLSINQNLNILEFVFSVLEKPNEIWNFAYQQQTDFTSKIYLNHLFMFGNSCDVKRFEKSFKKRIDFEIKTNNYESTKNEFRICTELMDSFFIQINTCEYGPEVPEVTFINPSFIDFLLQEVRSNKNFIMSSVLSFDYVDILSVRFNHKKRELEKLLPRPKLRTLLLNAESYAELDSNLDRMEYLSICSEYFTPDEVSEIFINEIIFLIEQKINDEMMDSYIDFANSYYKLSNVNTFFKANFNDLVSEILHHTKYKETFDETLTLFYKFNIDIHSFTSEYENDKLFYFTLRNVLDEEIENSIIFRKERLRTFEDVENFYEEIKFEYNQYLKNLYAPKQLIENILDSKDWKNILDYNNFKQSGLE